MRRLLCMSFIVLFIFPKPFAVADQDALSLNSLLMGWRDYEGVAITANAIYTVSGKPTEKMRLRITYGESGDPQRLRPISVESLVPNPGEPHIDDAEITDAFAVVTDGIVGTFQRKYITKQPPRLRTSQMIMTPGTGLGQVPFSLYHNGLQMGITGGPMDQEFGTVELAEKNLRLQVLGDDEFLGFPAKHIRYKYDKTRRPEAGELTVEMLVATEPTVQVLKVLRVESSIPAIEKTTREILESRSIQKLEVIEGMLIPTEFEINFSLGSFFVTVEDVHRLPEGHHGLWKLDCPTGTEFAGPAQSYVQKIVRHDRVRRGVSKVPYTTTESDKIRQYLIAHQAPVTSDISWKKVLLYLANASAIALLAWVGYRRFLHQPNGRT